MEKLNLAVCGAHMRDLALNHEMTSRGAQFVREDETSAHYRFFALEGGAVARPGLVRMAPGAPIALEIWAMPLEKVGGFLAGIPAPLGLGKLELGSGEWVTGFLCEAYGVEGAREITDLGGWRAFLAET